MGTDYQWKEGDRVTISTACNGCETGTVYTLRYGDREGCYKDMLHAHGINGELGCSCTTEWTLVNQTNNNTMSLKTFFTDLAATPEDKLLKKFNIEEPIGTPTAEGLELSAAISYKFNRAEIIKLAEQMEKINKAEAKK